MIENYFEDAQNEKYIEERLEYNPSAYLDKFSPKRFERYNVPYQDELYEKVEEKTKIFQDETRNRFSNESGEENEARIFKDITNDSKNIQQENEILKSKTTNKFYYEDYSYGQKYQNLPSYETPASSYQFVSLKENVTSPGLPEGKVGTSKKTEEPQISEKIVKFNSFLV